MKRHDLPQFVCIRDIKIPTSIYATCPTLGKGDMAVLLTPKARSINLHSTTSLGFHSNVVVVTTVEKLSSHAAD